MFHSHACVSVDRQTAFDTSNVWPQVLVGLRPPSKCQSTTCEVQNDF